MSTTGVSVSVLAGVPLLAGADEVSLAALSAEAEPSRVQAGEWALREGDEARELYVVLRGRLRVVAEDGRTLRFLGPGAAIGELALLTGDRAPPPCRPFATRRSSGSPASRFDELMERDAHFAATVARELAVLLQASGGLSAPPARPSLFALRPLGPGVPVDAVARSLAHALERYGTVEILGPTQPARAPSSGPRTSRRTCCSSTRPGSARGATSAPGRPTGCCSSRRGSPLAGAPAPNADLVILGPAEPGVVGRLLDTVEPRALHRLATTQPVDPGVGRLARRLVGRALGIVLSGGGARGFAHIGALAELARDGIEIDRYGGCSMGSFIAAMAAAGWKPEEIRDRCHEELVRRSPFNDYTLPRVALIRSRKAGRMLERLFGELAIEELAKPLFTVSADLLSSRLVVHRRGSLLEAVGASMSIPGLVPPLPRAGRLLVDGGVLNNLPVDAMAETAEGPIVAVDVVRRLERADVTGEQPLPSIVETLSRATVLGSVERAEANRELALLVLSPDVQDVPLRDFRALDRAVEAGRIATRAALDGGARDTILGALAAPLG